MFSTGQSKSRRFEELALPHLNAAYNLARWLLARDEQHAEDVVQEAFLRAYKFFDGFHGDDVRPWLLAIVRNACYTWLRRNRDQRLNEPYDEELHGGQTETDARFPDPESSMSQRDSRQLLNRTLEKLAPEFREILILREVENLSYKQIAGIADIPMGTVMSRLARARKLLWEYRQQMEREF